MLLLELAIPRDRNLHVHVAGWLRWDQLHSTIVISVHMSLQVAIAKICHFMHLQLAYAHCCRLLSLRPAAHRSSFKQGCFYREWPLGPNCDWHVNDDNAGCSSWDQLLDALVAIKCDSSKNNIRGLKEERIIAKYSL